jgi:glycosyltransferase involved in cell wall biosynthesis
VSTHADRLSVLHVFSGDLWAGAEVMIFNLLNRLQSAPRVRLTALSLNEGVLTEKLREAGVETWVIPESTHSMPSILVEAFRLFRHRSLDIVHSHRYKEHLLAVLLARSLGVRRLVATLHGLSEMPTARVPPRPALDCAILKRYFTRVVAVSREVARTLTETYRFDPAQVDVIANGVPVLGCAVEPVLPRPGGFHIGTVGRLVPVKDFNLFLEMAAAILRQTDDVRFSILGDGPLRSALSRTVRDLNLQASVDLLAPRADPVSYYRSLDIYVNTSRDEGLPLSVLEAMACGTPVVAPLVGGIPEIIADGVEGFLVRSRCPTEFAGSCVALIKDRDLRVTMARNALTRARLHYSDRRMAECYEKLYLACGSRLTAEPA